MQAEHCTRAILIVTYEFPLHHGQRFYMSTYTGKDVHVSTEDFHEYLCGSSFVVITDNNPLSYTVKLDAT